MQIKIQTIRFSKDYFSSYEKCAAWLEKFSVQNLGCEELEKFFVFEQVSKEKFNDASLQEIVLGSGVSGVVGVAVCCENTLENIADADTIVPTEIGVPSSGTLETEEDMKAKVLSTFTSALDALKEYFAAESEEEDEEDEDESEDEGEDTMEKNVVSTSILKGSSAEPRMKFRVPIIKKTAQRIVFGEVLVPDTVDAQGHIYSELEVEKAAHYWMKEFQQLGEMHTKMLADKQSTVLESYVAPVDFEVDGGTLVKKGTWLLKLYVDNDDLWDKVSSGEYTGFSIQGLADAENLTGE